MTSWFTWLRVFFGACLLLALCESGCSPSLGVPVFLFHSVGEGSAADHYDVPSDEFDRELSIIESFGAKTITFDQLFAARYGHGTIPERAVIITFDDGRACQYRAAMPVLLRHGMAAETFVVGQFLAEDEAHRYVEHDAGGEHPFLLWSELGEMEKSGAFHIESHSMTHRRHTVLSREAKFKELSDSRQLLAGRLGVPIDFFAYPLGGFDSDYRDEAEKAGYRGALAVQKGLGTRYAMLRVSLHRGETPVLVRTLTRYFGSRE